MAARVDGALEARRILERRGQMVEGLLNQQVSASWQRCLAAGMDPRDVPQAQQVDSDTLRLHGERCDAVIQLARVEMESLYHQIAGSNFLIAAGDAHGVVLDTIADPAFAASSAGRQIQAGSVWSEQLAGTNALGTATATRNPIIVHGAEHFFSCFDGITCAAAPIHHYDGTLAGVLDASSHSDAYPAHTLVLVRMAALNVANGLFQREMQEHFILAVHPRCEFIGSMAAGLIAVDDLGVIRGANSQLGALMPGIAPRPGMRFEEIFTEDFPLLVARLYSDYQTTVRDPLDRAYTLAWRNPGVATASSRRVALAPPQRSAALTGRAAPHRPLAAVPIRPRPEAIAESGASGFVHADARVRASLDLIEAAARLPAPILISGETGTGKEMMARYAHRVSGRKGAYVAVNCAAMPAELFEAELFGYVAGAFTGARKEGQVGLIAEASGGTLLLDEIGDLPLLLQAVLLRFLDDYQVRPVGGRETRAVDTLIIASTNADLAAEVRARRFRADLLYRLNTVQVELPPLRTRSDFRELAQHLLARIDAAARLSDEALAWLASQEWPGNVRELRSALTRARLAAQGPLIGLAQFAAPASWVSDPARPGSLRTLNGEAVLRTLRELGGNVSATASRLAISRNTVYRYLREAGTA